MIKSDPDQVTTYTTMTADPQQQSHGRDQLKRKLTLNIGTANSLSLMGGKTPTGSGSPSVIKRTRAQSRLEVLSSPDLQLLKLGSPEIERLILSQTNNLQTPTPISAYFLNNASPKNVTQEQEIYVKGFQEALSKLHQQNGGAGASMSGDADTDTHDTNNNTDWSSTCSEDSSSMQQAPVPATKRGRKATTKGAGKATTTRGGPATRRQTSTTSAASSTDTKALPRNPIDMGSQEKIKLERKRQRNRVAASKCRKRKLERIAKLEVKVNHLKVENVELNSMAAKLRDSVIKLKSEIEHHAAMGCSFQHLNNLLQ